jgi:hypothetical protein
MTNCIYGNPSAMLHYYPAPRAGRTRCTRPHGEGRTELAANSWRLTSEWIAPPEEPRMNGPSAVWPKSEGQPVIQIAMVKET